MTTHPRVSFVDGMLEHGWDGVRIGSSPGHHVDSHRRRDTASSRPDASCVFFFFVFFFFFQVV